MCTIGQSSSPRSQRPSDQGLRLRPRPQLGPALISFDKLIRVILLLKRYKMWVLQKKYLNIIERNVAYVLNVICFSHCVIMRRTGIRIMPVEPGSSVSIVSGYLAYWMTGRSRFDLRQRQRIFLLPSVSTPAVKSSQHSMEWVPEVLSRR
jgi:hypothetical protein